ncbi:MAG: peptidyl-prolyl cis-trans isomerase [Bacteroides sp.]|nr:peptidyl-prolyl cis-trans isomerase [Bacteroides sp.]
MNLVQGVWCAAILLVLSLPLSAQDERMLMLDAARKAGLDTQPAHRMQVDSCRLSLFRTYIREHIGGEVKRLPRYRLLQVFRRVAPAAPKAEWREAERVMDSIHHALSKGALFEECVTACSDDPKEMSVFPAQLPKTFEQTAFALKEGEVSAPFHSPWGLHIVKLVGREEVLQSDEGNRTWRLALLTWLKGEYGYVAQPLAAGSRDVDEAETVLFSVGDRNYTEADLARFARGTVMGRARLLENFCLKSLLEVARDSFLLRSPAYALHLKQYEDSLLLQAIWQQEIGSRLEDEERLQRFFEAHRSRYKWAEPHYRGAVLHAVSKHVAKYARKLLKKLPEEEWADALRLTFNAEGRDQVRMKQGLFAPGDHPAVDALVFKEGEYASPVSYPFTVVVGRKTKAPRSWQEVEERVKSDCRAELEQAWMARLRAVSDEEKGGNVLKSVNNSRSN